MLKINKVLIFLSFFNHLIIYAQETNSSNDQNSISKNKEWVEATPASVGIDPARLDTMLTKLETAKNHKLHSILIIKNEKLIFEKYFGRYDSSQTHDLRSATKSITSLLVGIAIDKGFIKSIDDPVYLYLRNYQQELQNKKNITIRHLLTMNSGLDCNDWNKQSKGQEDKMYKKKDWLKYFCSLEPLFSPGDTAMYCTGGIVALGEIIKQASGMDIIDFSERYLFAPLGIRDMIWQRFNQNTMTDTGGHLELSPRDMAKIGLLTLRKGQWDDQIIVAEQWIKGSVSHQAHLGGLNYGYLWWLFDFETVDKQYHGYFASGNGGQYIFVFPEMDMVVVFTGGNYNKPEARIPFRLLLRYIFPAIKKE